MRLISCLNPKKIKNPYTGELMYVPCGYCSACVQHRQLKWIERIKLESLCWKYSMFFTLTYADEYLPRMHYDGNTFQFLDTKRCNPELGGFVYYADDMFFSERDKKVLESYVKDMHGDIPFLNPYDVQLFFKRLRKYVQKEFNEKIRIIYVGEYGKLHLRPHYHGIIWTSNDDLMRALPEILHKMWRYGFTNTSVSEGRCADYVAKYIGKSGSVPVFLRQKRTTPFSICSKNPPLGSLVIPDEEVRRIFFEASSEVYSYSPSSHVFEDRPVWSFVQNRLFPLISRFNVLTHSMRVRLYDISSRYCDFEDFERSYQNGLFALSIRKYVIDITKENPFSSALYRLFNVSSRVCSQARMFGVSLDFYVTQIEKFYENKRTHNLDLWYSYQEEYSEDNDIVGLVGSDLIRLDHIMDTDKCLLTLSDMQYLQNINVDLDKFFSDDVDVRFRYRNSLHPFVSPDYAQLLINAECFSRRSERTKHKNEYNGLIL